MLELEDSRLKWHARRGLDNPAQQPASSVRHRTTWDAAITAGLRRISVHGVSVDNGSTSGPGDRHWCTPWGWVPSGLASAWCESIQRTDFWPWQPVRVSVGHHEIDGARLAEILRLIEIAEDRLPLTMGAFVAAVLGSIGLSNNSPKPKALVC